MTDLIPSPPVEPPTALPTQTRRRLSSLVAGLTGLVLGAGSVGGVWAISASDTSRPSKPTTFTLEGTFELTDSVSGDGDGGCMGRDGYDDIADGTDVTVYGASGAINDRT
jgi:hypothetical protein